MDSCVPSLHNRGSYYSLNMDETTDLEDPNQRIFPRWKNLRFLSGGALRASTHWSETRKVLYLRNLLLPGVRLLMANNARN